MGEQFSNNKRMEQPLNEAFVEDEEMSLRIYSGNATDYDFMKARVLALPPVENPPSMLSILETFSSYSDEMTEVQEAEWVQLARQGDRDALEKLYESYFDLIYSYFQRRVRNKSDAEALTSETFTRAIEALTRGQYEWQGKPFGTWLFRIADYTYREWKREHKKQPTIAFEDLDDSQPSTEKDGDILDLSLAREEQDQLWLLVHELPLVEQKILIFRHIDGLSYTEIAKYLQRSDSACKQLHYRALQKLKVKIQRSELGKEVLRNLEDQNDIETRSI